MFDVNDVYVDELFVVVLLGQDNGMNFLKWFQIYFPFKKLLIFKSYIYYFRIFWENCFVFSDLCACCRYVRKKVCG
jgi:hypothetical protein